MMKAYKLFRIRKDGTLGPLFINRKQVVGRGEWIEAENHPTKGYAVRFGWHCCSNPFAPHLSESPKSGEKRAWYCIEIDGVTKHQRPASQGGLWYTAKRMKVGEAYEAENGNDSRKKAA